MILTSHIIVSGLLGATTKNYFLAALFGLVSHYVLDGIPHWDYLSDEFESRTKTEKNFFKNKKFWNEIFKISIDIFIGLIFIFTILKISGYQSRIAVIISIFFGILPDPLGLLYWITKWKFIKWNADLQEFVHHSIHSKINQKFWSGIIIQTTAAVLAFLILRKF